jgi:hypothetical protein
MAVSARARARAWVCGRSECVALIFDVAMAIIDCRTVSVTSLKPDWLTNLGLTERILILVEVLSGCATAVELVYSTTITQHGECSLLCSVVCASLYGVNCESCTKSNMKSYVVSSVTYLKR